MRLTKNRKSREAPVMNEDASESMNSTAPVNSSGSAMRPSMLLSSQSFLRCGSSSKFLRTIYLQG
ncbi:hypothetical protein AC579_4499 [Pseudocercospora musae]|uniref:Uncharacterized protein n=1 Tax=Pseudocercospora musae TaxID=113226 RepID=A0A139IDH3_9PEZI|nr:hypothetical protein AC579_4499 [Pseudocercospora musae]